MSPQATQVKRVIGEIDPTAVECLNCRKFYDRTHVIQMPRDPRQSFPDDFAEWLHHRRLYDVCDYCIRLLKDAFITGYHVAEKKYMKDIEAIQSATKDRYMYNTGPVMEIKIDTIDSKDQSNMKKFLSRFDWFKDDPDDMVLTASLKKDLLNAE